MKRCLFNGLAVVSLLLCVATVVLWVRSHERDEHISGESLQGTLPSYELRRFKCASGAGGLCVTGLSISGDLLTDLPAFTPRYHPWQ